MHSDNVRYCGRPFTALQMEAIRALIADNPRASTPPVRAAPGCPNSSAKSWIGAALMDASKT